MADHIFSGSGVALITPTLSDGSVNYDVLGQLLEFQVIVVPDSAGKKFFAVNMGEAHNTLPKFRQSVTVRILA